MILRGAVKPIRQRRLGHPWMLWTDVVGHRIEEKLHALMVQLGSQILIIGETAEMRVDRVKIHGTVTVVILFAAIFYYGREPKPIHAQVCEIRNVIADTAQIAAMPGARLAAIV